jgi:hypothetical protein
MPFRDRRRTLIVNEYVQRRIVGAVILIPTVGLALCTVIVAAFCRKLLAETMRADVELPSLVPLFVSVLVFFVIASFVVAIQGLRFSHRIAGPCYRLCRSMERVRDGDIAFRVHLRKGDYLTEVASEFNRLLDWLNDNPPTGVRTGGDVVEVEHSDDEKAVIEVAEASES